ncbi:Tex family protein [Bacillus taeanensis]|uniref:RNA-binding transcriptional accessory protein n=1 Tax=Bacillus taeanensis TaxID=273032 RepID=A0A366XUQ6_9BACI|nr:Tex family protein [Bacillus taeanensis]RBW67854.1 RNA-binding transcriptional accessory protein [Bacillus taeanensis]
MLTEEQKRIILSNLAQQLQLKPAQINNVVTLLQEGNTVPFIARYRKEMTGELDEVTIRNISEGWTYAQNLEARKQEVIRLIQEQNKLTEPLQKKIEQAKKLQEVEDLYRPYKQKRRTKATVAKEKGLEPFAEWLFQLPNENVEQKAAEFVSAEKEVKTIEAAIEGAQDIIAEWISDNADMRKKVRDVTFRDGKLVSSLKDKAEDEKKIYQMYYEYEEPLRTVVPHRILAMNRGEKEDILKVKVEAPLEKLDQLLKKTFILKPHVSTASYIESAVEDAYKRLIEPSIEREIRKELTEKAEDQAIHIFSENLKHLLLQPPLKGKVVLGVDPAYRTGCKLAVVDQTGKVLHIAVIYPTPPKSEVAKAKDTVVSLIKEYSIEMIAIGNGTASRETEQFIVDTIKEVNEDVFYLIVNEAGASVYSASDLAREEFPDLQVEERSAVSIARRLQDPLAELVKIDPKSVGVGQYQHDVSQKNLNDSLTFVVETVVNQVGVNVNTASASLLQYVAGLSKSVAQNIVKKREEEGSFISRKQLKKIPRLGAKTYEQCIGFLRIPDGEQPLDQTAIHPESYEDTVRLLETLGCTVNDLGTEQLKEKLEDVEIKEASQQLEVGELTLRDIIDALIRPRRDPRDELMKPLLRTDILKMEDLQKGMQLEGTIRNVVDFGAFVDIGVKQDGLVHISKLTNRFVKHPLDVVHVGQVVTVWVEEIDLQRGRAALTMLSPEQTV